MTGVGSLPVTDPGVAARLSAQECPALPFVPELPGRGPGADMIGRTAGWLSSVVGEFGLETTADGWRLTAGRGRDMKRATAMLRADRDAVAEEFAGYTGPLKASLAGPWTLAAAIEDASGEKAVRDEGFVREMAQALSLAAVALIADLRWRAPGASVVLQWDEPGLAAVRAGGVRSASGLRRFPPVPDGELGAVLRSVLESVLEGSGGAPQVMHICSAEVPWEVVAMLPLVGLSTDWTLHRPDDDDHLGSWLESGRGVIAGVWPTDGSAGAVVAERARAAVVGPLRRLGLDPAQMHGWTALSARCGLAGAPQSALRPGLDALAQLGRHLRDET